MPPAATAAAAPAASHSRDRLRTSGGLCPPDPPREVDLLVFSCAVIGVTGFMICFGSGAGAGTVDAVGATDVAGVDDAVGMPVSVDDAAGAGAWATGVEDAAG